MLIIVEECRQDMEKYVSDSHAEIAKEVADLGEKLGQYGFHGMVTMELTVRIHRDELDIAVATRKTELKFKRH